MKSVGALLDEKIHKNRPKNLTQEFQVYGCAICEALEDTKHYSLYIKLAKDYPRALLEQAKNFVIDYPSAKSKPKLFMWKLGQLKKADTESQSAKE